jgi:Flp pilus assembly protein TadG
MKVLMRQLIRILFRKDLTCKTRHPMIKKQLPRGKKSLLKNAAGAAAVEYGLVLPIVILLMLGGMDFAHMFYMQHVLTNASREGARYTSIYTGNANPPSDVENYIKSRLNYNSFNFDNLTVSSSVSGTPKIITVTVEADKNWWILNSMLGLTNPRHLTARTAMMWQGP